MLRSCKKIEKNCNSCTVYVFSASVELVATTSEGHGELRLSGTGQQHHLAKVHASL